MISDAEHLFVSVDYLCVSFGKRPIQGLCLFFELYVFDKFSPLNYLYILDINPLSDTSFETSEITLSLQ